VKRKLQFDVVTIFPEMFDAITRSGVTARARTSGAYEVVLWNPRDFCTGVHRSIDDRPYGGGPGMVMMAEPLAKAIRSAGQRQLSCGVKAKRVVYLSPQGVPLKQRRVKELGKYDGLVLISGRYEGVDERLIAAEVDEEISIGDYVLSGGELPAMVLMDALIRLMPGVLGDAQSSQQESFEQGLLDCPHYTRPEVYGGIKVPEVLLSGNHAAIARWRHKQSLGRTLQRRPDMISGRERGPEELALLKEYLEEQSGPNEWLADKVA
jgi:tRNA (guanine37-N1)-methyltransferase